MSQQAFYCPFVAASVNASEWLLWPESAILKVALFRMSQFERNMKNLQAIKTIRFGVAVLQGI